GDRVARCRTARATARDSQRAGRRTQKVIHFITGEYPPAVGGVGDYTLQLRSALADIGWESDVLSRPQVRHWDARSLVALLRSVPRHADIVHIQFQAGAFDLLGDVFRSKLGIVPQDLAVVYFGLMNASKGLNLLLDSFEQVLTRCPGARLLLVGGTAGASDPTDRVTAAGLRYRLGQLARSVVQTGWLSPSDVSAYLVAGDVALLPYADGASPRRGSLLACAAHGLP